MRIGIFFFVAIGPAFLAACKQKPPAEPPIYTQLTRSLDVTGDRQPEMITLHLKAASAHSPVLWILTIESAGATIYEHDSDDEDVDALFSDREQMPWCPDYLSCKQQYYFNDLLNNLVVRDYDLDSILDVSDGNSLYPSGRAYLSQCCNLFGAPAERILQNLESKLRAGAAIVITVPASPVAAGPLMVWAPEAMQFVPVYEN